MDLADSDSLSRVESYSGAEPAGHEPSRTGLSPAVVALSRDVPLAVTAAVPLKAARSYYPAETSPGGLGWCLFARRYWGSRCCFPFLGVLRCFSSPRSPRPVMESPAADSGIPGSMLV